MTARLESILAYLGDETEHLLGHTCTAIPKSRLHLPGSDFVSRVFGPSDRNIRVMRSIQQPLQPWAARRYWISEHPSSRPGD